MAFPTPATGSQGYGDSLAAGHVVEISDIIAQLDKDKYPITTVLLNKNAKKPVVNPKFSMLYDVFTPEFFTVTISTTYASNATSIVLDDAAGVSIGDILAIWLPNTGKPAAEQVLVTNKSSNTLTISRAYRFYTGTTQTTIPDETVFQIIGTAKGDKSTYADAVAYGSKTLPMLEVVNYCQYFEEVVPISRIEKNTDHYGTPDFQDFQTQKKMKEIKRRIEAAILFGVPGLDSSVTLTGPSYAGNVFTTGGCYHWISQTGANYSYPSAPGVVQDQAELTEAEFRDFLARLFDHGSDTKWLFASRHILQAIESWEMADLRLQPGAEAYGVRPRTYYSTVGTLNIMHHPMLEVLQKGNTAGPLQLDASATTGTQGMAFALDMDDIRLRYLQNMDLQVELDVGVKGDNVRGNKISGMYGLELRTPPYHGMIRNVGTYAA